MTDTGISRIGNLMIFTRFVLILDKFIILIY